MVDVWLSDGEFMGLPSASSASSASLAPSQDVRGLSDQRSWSRWPLGGMDLLVNRCRAVVLGPISGHISGQKWSIGHMTRLSAIIITPQLANCFVAE